MVTLQIQIILTDNMYLGHFKIIKTNELQPNFYSTEILLQINLAHYFLIEKSLMGISNSVTSDGSPSFLQFFSAGVVADRHI